MVQEDPVRTESVGKKGTGLGVPKNPGGFFSTSLQVPSADQALNDSKLAVGGRLLKFFPAWENISGSLWILDLIKTGLKFDFCSLPPTCFLVTGFHLSKSGQIALQLEVRTLIKKEALVPVSQGEEGLGFYSTLFLVRKKTRWRIQDHHQPKTPEQVSQVPKVQNGNIKIHRPIFYQKIVSW